MIAMKIGTNDITDLKIGTTEINEVRLGSVLVWERNSYLLDLYPATVAYSLRKLRSAYTGAAIRVRRSLDNTEQDIGFLADELDIVSLLLFVGVGDGFVTTWYGQDTVGINLMQTSLIRQPRIVQNGVLVTDGGKPAINFHIANIINHSNLQTNVIPVGSRVTPNSSFYGVSKYTSQTQRRLFISDFGNLFFSLFPDTQTPTNNSSYPVLNQAYLNGVLTIIGQRGELRNAIGTNRFIVSVNNYALLNGTTNRIELGREGSIIGDLDYYQELIIYSTDQSTNRTAIETNINNYYNVY